MNLNSLLKKVTPEEANYRAHPGTLGAAYKNIRQINFNNRNVYQFRLPFVNQHIVEIRKDSRFTSVPPYVHTNVNLNYIYSGECTYVLDGQEITFKHGDICIFDTDVIRSKKVTNFDDIVINISLSNQFFTSEFISRLRTQGIVYDFLISALSQSENHDNFIMFRNHQNQKIIELFNGLLEEYFGHHPFSVDVINSYMIIIFTELMRSYNKIEPDQYFKIHKKINRRILPILQYVDKNASSVSLEKVADHFGYHPNYLATLIKSATGESFTQIRKQKRLELATQLLITTPKTIEDIAHQIGMSNISNFYKEFVRSYQITPATYRKKYQP